MKPAEPSNAPSALAKLQRLSRLSVWISAAAIALASGVLIYLFWGIASGDAKFVGNLLEEIGIPDDVTTLSPAMRWLIGLIWISTDILGLVFLIQVHALFRGFLNSGVFTIATPRRLRRIGLIILSLGPVSMLAETLDILLIGLWQGNTITVSISIEDSDVYAIIVGLVITAASHIMLEASRLADENQAFI
jgi:hypothetical protein